MKPDDFEQKLQRQSLRQVPCEWREEILTAANSAHHPAPIAPRLNWLSTLFWPNQKAWAGLAALWFVILALNFSMHDKSDVIAKKSSPPSPELIMALRQQQRMYAELIGPQGTTAAEPPRSSLPQPRSERCDEILNA